MMMPLKLEHAHTHGWLHSVKDRTHTHTHLLDPSPEKQQDDILLVFALQWAETCCGSLHSSTLNVSFWHSYQRIQKENVSGKQGEKLTLGRHLYSPTAIWKTDIQAWKIYDFLRHDVSWKEGLDWFLDFYLKTGMSERAWLGLRRRTTKHLLKKCLKKIGREGNHH